MQSINAVTFNCCPVPASRSNFANPRYIGRVNFRTKSAKPVLDWLCAHSMYLKTITAKNFRVTHWPVRHLPSRCFSSQIRFSELPADQILGYLDDHPEIKARELANAILQVTRKQGKAVDVIRLKPWLQILESKFDALDGQAVSKVFLLCGPAQVDRKFWNSLCTRAQNCSFNFTDIPAILDVLSNSTTMFRKKRGLSDNESDLLKRLCSVATIRATDFNPQAIANTFNLLARMNFRDKALFDRFCIEAVNKSADFSAQGIANTLNAMSKLGIHDRQLVKKLCEAGTTKLTDFGPQGITNTLNALSKLDAKDEPLISLLCGEGVGKASEFTPQHIAITLNAMSKLVGGHELLVKALCEEIPTKVEDFSSQELATTLGALARLGVRDELLINRLCDEVSDKAVEFNAQEIANTLNALRKFDMSSTSTLADRLCVEANASEFKPLELNTTLHALGQLETKDDKLYQRLCQEARGRSAQFSLQDIANFLITQAASPMPDESLVRRFYAEAMEKLEVDACAPDVIVSMLQAITKIKIIDENLVAKLCTKAMEHSEFDPETLPLLLNALGKLGVQDETWTNHLCEEMARISSNFSAKGIATTLGSLARLGIRNETLVTKLCALGIEKLAEFNAREISSTITALYKLDRYDELVDRLCVVGVEKANDFNPQDISVVLHALSNLRVFDVEFVKAMRKTATAKANEFSPQSISVTLNALANFGVRDRRLMKLLCDRAMATMSSFVAQSVVSMLHALVCMHYKDNVDTIFPALIGRLRDCVGDEKTLSLAATNQYILCRISMRMLYFSVARMPSSRFIYVSKQVKTTMHRQIERALTSLNLSFEAEYNIQGLLADFAFPRERKLIEVIDRSKVFRGDTRVLGHVKFKRELLAKMGWKIVIVRFAAWERLTTPQREQRLSALLRTVGKSTPQTESSSPQTESPTPQSEPSTPTSTQSPPEPTPKPTLLSLLTDLA